jgi:hypothetical protein
VVKFITNRDKLISHSWSQISLCSFELVPLRLI